MNLFTVPGNGSNGIPHGAHFIAHNRIENDHDMLGGMTADEFKGWMFSRFRESYAAKKPEIERLKQNELYYAGFHFLDAQMNREMEVTNLCFATVETVHPTMVEQKPRPEIVPRRQYDVPQGAQDPMATIQEYAQWVMDTTEFDLCYYLNTREKLKYGWCVTLLVVDPATGICFPKVYSVFDFYKDPYARHEDEMEFFFLAAPVATEWLKARYPDQADAIQPDNVASPAYDVLERPYFDAINAGGDYSSLDNLIPPGGTFHLEGTPDPGGGQPLVTPESGSMQNTGTTFLIQGFFRDRRKIPVHYSGDIAQPSEAGDTFVHTPSVRNYVRPEPCAESGWVCVPMTAAGVLLKPHAVDPCFLGIPLEFGRDYHQAGRFYCPGEIDNLIPINRGYNRRKNLLNRSLEFSAVPILVADSDTGIDIDQRAVEPGDVLKKVRGTDIHWLDFRGTTSDQFEMLSLEKGDAQHVSGVQDVSEGRRPEGIEAAAAIRNLQDAAQTRIRGKEGPAQIEWARILKKMLVATGKKCKQAIYFRGRNGQSMSIDPAWLTWEYDIRFARGTGSVLGRAANEEKIKGLAEAGLIDHQSALEALDIPNIPTIMQRTAQGAAQPDPAAVTAQAAMLKAVASVGIPIEYAGPLLLDSGMSQETVNATLKGLSQRPTVGPPSDGADTPGAPTPAAA